MLSSLKTREEVCSDCKKPMDGGSCTHRWMLIDGATYSRAIKDAEIAFLFEPQEQERRCGDCAIDMKVGNVHHFGCDMERCPKCGKQLISCNCHHEATATKKKDFLYNLMSYIQIRD